MCDLYYMRVSVVAIAILLGCSGSDNSGSGTETGTDTDGSTGNTIELKQCPEEEGSRLKFKKYVAENGDFQRIGLHDVKYGNCYLDYYVDSNKKKSWACVPGSNSGTVHYTDTGCENPIVHFRKESSVQDFVPEYSNFECGTHPVLFVTGEKLEAPPAAVYKKSFTGQCVADALQDGGVYLSSTGSLKTDDLITFSEELFSDGNYRLNLYKGNDGSTICDQTDIVDLKRESVCQIANDGTGEKRCIPYGADLIDGFSDSECTSISQAGQLRSCDSPPYARDWEKIDECTTKIEVYSLNTDAGIFYQTINDSCQLRTLSTILPIKEKLSNNDLGSFTHYVDETTEDRLKRLYFKSDDNLLVDRGGVVGHKIGELMRSIVGE